MSFKSWLARLIFENKKDEDDDDENTFLHIFTHLFCYSSCMGWEGRDGWENSRSVTVLESKYFNYTSSRVIETEFGFGVCVVGGIIMFEFSISLSVCVK